MGMDIYSEHGVVLEVSEICNRLFGGVKKKQFKTMCEALAQYLVEHNADKQFDGAITTLPTIKDGKEFGDWFTKFCEDQLESDYGDAYFATEEHMSKLWNIALDVLGVDFPAVTFHYWTRSRLNGWDVPIDTPCIVIDDTDLFETRMTSRGKRVAKLLGVDEITSTTWTIMSV